jgi:hypothetical protein
VREPRGISTSEISAFLECRRKWYLSHYLALHRKQRTVVGAAQLGSRIHLGLSEYNLGRDHVSALEALRDDELNLVEQMAISSDPDEIEKEHAFALLIIDGYLQWLEETGNDQQFEVRAVEKQIEAPSPIPTRYWLKGKCDVLLTDLRTGWTGIRDYKSVGSLTTGLSVLNLNQQARMYALIERLNSPDDYPQFVQWELLLKSKRTQRSKPPYYARHEIRFNEDELKRFWDRLYGILSDIAAVEDALDNGADHVVKCYPHPTNDCQWKCEFLPICALLDDPRSDARGILEDHYEVHDPYARYGV